MIANISTHQIFYLVNTCIWILKKRMVYTLKKYRFPSTCTLDNWLWIHINSDICMYSGNQYKGAPRICWKLLIPDLILVVVCWKIIITFITFIFHKRLLQEILIYKPHVKPALNHPSLIMSPSFQYALLKSKDC